MLEEYLKKTEAEYYPPVENLLDLMIYEHYTEKNPVEKNTSAVNMAPFLSGRQSSSTTMGSTARPTTFPII
jgi:hypothetical protein